MSKVSLPDRLPLVSQLQHPTMTGALMLKTMRRSARFPRKTFSGAIPMEIKQSAHPSPRQLAALALGKLKPDARDRLQAHVSTCATCETFLAQTPPENVEFLAPTKCSAAKHGRTIDIVRPAGTRHQSGLGHVAAGQRLFGG